VKGAKVKRKRGKRKREKERDEEGGKTYTGPGHQAAHARHVPAGEHEEN
jgi:hypothetical protein